MKAPDGVVFLSSKFTIGTERQPVRKLLIRYDYEGLWQLIKNRYAVAGWGVTAIG